MYKDVYHPQVKKDVKKLDIQVKKEIQDYHINIILKDPFKYELLTGNFSGVYSYHFKKNKVEYRICYMIDNNKKVVYILMIGKRENFYNLLQRRL